VAASVGRPSRRKKEPGILPAAYIFSSKSTVRGKKSTPSRGSAEAVAVARITVSPQRTRALPLACSATRPISMVSVLPDRGISNR